MIHMVGLLLRILHLTLMTADVIGIAVKGTLCFLKSAKKFG
jgi:hypothetical protein